MTEQEIQDCISAALDDGSRIASYQAEVLKIAAHRRQLVAQLDQVMTRREIGRALGVSNVSVTKILKTGWSK